LQKIVDLSINNNLWNDAQWYAEEQFSGLQVKFHITRNLNTIEAHDNKIHHCFQEYRDLPLFKDLGESVFSAVLISPEGLGRKYIKTLINSGVMGAEKLQHQNGHIRLVLTDILMIGGVDLSQFEFKDRRIYLESLASFLIERKLVPHVIISDIIKTDKKLFFDFISDRGARGIILKDAMGKSEDRVFKVASRAGGAGVGNVTLNRNWQALEKKTEQLEEFDYDTFLAVQFLNKSKNEKLLTSVIS
jgi:hypothetical protein